ncbi:MAG: anaerobic ribonucleoside-triphosphate reductase activating protein [Ruminococcaceae bacterium]|nr:anaerobic ribonucleoside-triphosphate reductase activating protein [Oscillospiraceae bacterium]
MIFGGFQKLTLLDFPGRVACTVFTKGCNFYCPFCHNSFLVDVTGKEQSIPADEVLDYLQKRFGILDGVCITGGEPLLHPETEEFITQVKALGYAVKLDTNGSFPKRLKALAQKNLIDYVAMDIKNCFEKYPLTAGCATVDMDAIEESIDFLLGGSLNYEFRTTVADPLHTPEDIENIAKRISGAKKYFLQNFVDSGNIICNDVSFSDENVLKKLQPIEENVLKNMKNFAQKYVKNTAIRGES